MRRLRAGAVYLPVDVTYPSEPVLWMASGHEPHRVDDVTRRDPVELLAALRASRIDVIEVTPSRLRQLLDAGWLPPERPRRALTAPA
ncbi:hypothetical protein AB0J21_30545 [Streptomyces sp. NPDC049954]|uniref:hypothetical protein n=1 Tax=Streptomyces sp. NPDC049954 TaxID=3155779 RepID=UPI003432843D